MAVAVALVELVGACLSGSIALLAACREESLHRRGFLEVLGDAFGSAAVIVSGLVVLATGFDRADSTASLVVAVLILPRAWSLLRGCVGVLLEAAPPGVDVEDVSQHLAGASGMVEVHDLHAWQITSGMPAMSAHVAVADETLESRGVGQILDELSDRVATHFGIDHATFQVEPEGHQDQEPGGAHR